MTMTDLPAPRPTPAPPVRRLRRSTTDRVGAGVAGGLGDYFGVDPVLFRVLFATSAFFGGTGILAYLLAWAAIPEQGTENAPIDGWVGRLRRRRVPPWLVAVGGGLLLWGVAFSWWAPGPFLPVLAVVVLLVVVFGRREWQAADAAEPSDGVPGGGAPAAGAPGRVDLTKRTTASTWVDELRAWVDEARQTRRARRRRALPVKIATLGVLVATLATLGVVDSVTGVQLQTYFWLSLGIVVAGLLVGLALRRAPWSVATLLPPLAIGAVAFAGSHTQLGDGIGQHEWRPTATPAAGYRLAFGQGVLDLTALPSQQVARTIDVRVGAGQVKIIAPASMNLTVHAAVHLGQVQVRDGGTVRDHGGVGFDRVLAPPAGATGAPIGVTVHLADGQITLIRR